MGCSKTAASPRSPASRRTAAAEGGSGAIEWHEELVVEGADIGGRRSAWVHAPDGVEGRKLPVVLAFHGGKGNSGRDMAPRWQHLFDEPVIFVFPNGQVDDPGEAGWTGVGRPAPNGDELVDVRFVGRLIDALAARYPVDLERVYAVGHSNGGQMTWNLACAMPERLAGIAIVSKSVPKALVDRCDIDERLPLIYVTGTADRDTWDEGRHTLSAEDSLAWWLRKQGCALEPEAVVTLPESGDGTRAKRRDYRCPPGSGVTFFLVENGGHPWPSQHRTNPGASRSMDASDEIYGFFRKRGGM